MKSCDKCAHAIWNRTANGRLHPNKQGRCGFPLVIPQLPNAMYWISSAPKPSGGFIKRGHVYETHCAYYQREEGL